MAAQSGNGKKRVGILGGTFDPIHNAHLAIAEKARSQLDLDFVLFIPAGQPWMKSDRTITPAEHRVAMVRLSIKNNPHFKLSLVEVERPGPSYTVDTLLQLRREFGDSTDYFLILGQDSLEDFAKWKEPARILKMAHLVVLPRPGYEQTALSKVETISHATNKRIMFLEIPPIDISATEIRELVASGKPVDSLVPGEVAKYIKKHGLYR